MRHLHVLTKGSAFAELAAKNCGSGKVSHKTGLHHYFSEIDEYLSSGSVCVYAHACVCVCACGYVS